MSFADTEVTNVLPPIAAATAPATALIGQIWYDLTNKIPMIWTGAAWAHLVGGTFVGLTELKDVDPAAPKAGEVLVFDATAGKWKAGSGWVSAGNPANPSGVV